MKPKIVDLKSIEYEPGVTLAVMLFRFADGHEEERFFLYSVPEITTCGGMGWKSLEKLVQRYEFWKQIGRI